MPTFTKKRRCPTCDHRNPVDEHRCGVCTRVLDSPDDPIQAVFDETMWAEPVSTRHVPRRTNGFTLGFICLGAFVGLFAANVVATGSAIPYPIQHLFADKGADWKTYAGNPAFRAVLPGEPIGENVNGPTGPLTSSSVWIDSRWHEVLDANTISPANVRDARTELHAAVVIATGTATGDARLSAPDILAALRPGATLTEAETSGVEKLDRGTSFDVTASYAGWPDEAGRGSVSARFLEVDGTLIVIASYVDGGSDEELQTYLVDNVDPV